MAKLTPNKIISRFLKQKGIKLQDVATALEIHPSTFSHNLKKLGSENYSRDFANRLAKELHVPLSAIEESCRRGEDISPDVFRSLVGRLSDYFKTRSDSYMKEILEITTKLREGGSFTLVTCYVPIECYDAELAETIAEAIKKRNVKFRYIFPDKKERDRESEYGQFIEPYLTADTRGWKEIEKEFKSHFIAKLKDKYGISKKQVEKNVIWTFTSNPILMTPFSKFILITQKEMGETNFVVFSEARMRAADDYSTLTCWYPMPRIEAQKIEEEINKICECVT